MQANGPFGLHHQRVADQIVDLVNHQQSRTFARQLDAATGDGIVDRAAPAVNGEEMAGFETFLGTQVDDDAAVLGDLGHVGIQLRDDKTISVRRDWVRLETVEFTLRLDLEQPVTGTNWSNGVDQGEGCLLYTSRCV